MIRIGTRGSKLALKQASLVQEALRQADAGLETELVILHTRGDRIQDRPLSAIGEKGVFAAEFEQALLRGKIDLAVHSAKDLPVELADGLTICAVLPRADVRDVLVVPKGGRVPSERQEAEDGGSRRPFRIGSGSRRRQMLAEKVWENIICEDIRGNVDTRLRKLQEGSYDGLLLAKAGLDRLGIGLEQAKAFDFYPLPPEQFLPAACQGIIAVEAVQESAAAQICKKITDEETALCFLVEREVLQQLSADCSEAAAAWCRRAAEGTCCGEPRETDEKILEMMGQAEGQYCEVTHRMNKQSRKTEHAEDRLLLDVMYARKRVQLACPVSAEEGRALAGQAAKMIKEQAE